MTQNCLADGSRASVSPGNDPGATLYKDGGGRREAHADQEQLRKSVSMSLRFSAMGAQASVVRNDGFAIPALLHDSPPRRAAPIFVDPSSVLDTPRASSPIHRTRRLPPSMMVR